MYRFIRNNETNKITAYKKTLLVDGYGEVSEEYLPYMVKVYKVFCGLEYTSKQEKEFDTIESAKTYVNELESCYTRIKELEWECLPKKYTVLK